MKNNTFGFTITEVLVALGISTLLAVGTGALLIEGMTAYKNQQVKAEALNLAHHIRMQLQGQVNSKLQAKGKASGASVADKLSAKNCGGIVKILQPDHAIAVSESQSAAGTQLRIIINGVNYQKNAVVKYGSASMHIDDLIFTNADAIAQDGTRSLLSGEIFVSISRVGSSSVSKKFRRHFVTRAALELAASPSATASVNDIITCNVQSALTISAGDCIGDSYYFDTALNKCVKKVSDSLSTVQLCPPGFFGNSDGQSNATCTPLSMTCGDYLAEGVNGRGQMDCSSQKPVVAAPIPPDPPITVVTGPPPPISPTPPPSAPPAPPAPAPPAVITTTASCACGLGSVPHGSFCSYCVYDVDSGYGYGFYYPTAPTIETIYEVHECVDGALRPLPSTAILTIPLLNACNGSSRPAIRFGTSFNFYIY